MLVNYHQKLRNANIRNPAIIILGLRTTIYFFSSSLQNLMIIKSLWLVIEITVGVGRRIVTPH